MSGLGFEPRLRDYGSLVVAGLYYPDTPRDGGSSTNTPTPETLTAYLLYRTMSTMNDTSGSEYVTSEDGVYRVDQIAYEIWTWKAQRSNKETARQLGELGFEGITTKQVAAWAMSYKWSVLADNDIKNLAPSIHNETLGGLIIAGLKGQRVLDKLLEEWMEKRIEPNAQVVKMLDMTFKYAGMSPMGTRDPTERVRSKGGAASSIVERYLSPEEIAYHRGEGELSSIPEYASEESEG